MKSIKVVAGLVVVAVLFVGCQKPVQAPKTNAVAETNLLKVAEQLEDTLHRTLDIHASGTDTNLLLKKF